MPLPKEYLVEILESISDGFISMDNRLVVNYFNKAAENLLNRKREDVLNKNLFEIFPEAKGSIFEEKYTQAVRTKRPLSFETFFDTAPYTNWYEVRVFPYEHGISVYFLIVSERKHVKELLEKSESLYQDIVETSQDLIWQCDEQGRYIYLNPAWEDTFGYGIEEMLGKKFSDFLSPEAAEKDEKIFSHLIKGNTVKGHETVHLGKDGRNIHLVFNAKFVKDENGNIAGTRGTAYDITHRKNAENELRKAQKFNEAILSATPDTIYVYDIINKTNVYSNDSINRTLGYTVKEIKEMGDTILETLMHPEDFQQYLNNILPCYETIQNDNIIEHEYRMKHKSGHWRWLHSKESIFLRDRDGRSRQIFGIVSDITEQKSAEQRIRKSEEEYRSLFNRMLDGCALHEIICNENGIPIDYRFINVNPAFERLTGLKSKDLIGNTVLEVLPGTEKHWIETYGRVALTGEPVTFENYAKEFDKHFEVTAYCPAPNQFACIFQDITPRIKAEEERKAFEKQLRQAHKLEAIGTLAGGLAHNFNNILYAIIGYAELAKDEIPDGSLAGQNINEVLKAGTKASELIKQMLEFSRKEGQKQMPVKIFQVLKESLNFIEATIPSTIEIRHDLNPHCGTIMANPTQLNQVIMNLCSNAAHAMKKSGGILSIGLNRVKLNADDLQNENHLAPGYYISISVEDTGAGIEKENIEKIFDPYFTTKDIGEGSGMGLAVVHGIVKKFNGIIKVNSVSGRGSAFRLFFPEINHNGKDQENGD